MSKIQSFIKELVFDSEKIKTQVILETSFSKEIRIALSKDQFMKQHKAPLPIIIHLLEGKIILGIGDEKHEMKSNDIVTLEGNVPHDLLAQENSIVRLSLSKHDKIERVESVVKG